MITNRSVSLSDQIYDELENDILTGNYKRGEIITETQISEKLGVSRTPVREAIRRLEQEHMVEDSGKGLMVLGITDKDAECIYDIREKIEGMAAAGAAKNATTLQLQAMKESIDMQEFYISKEESEKIREMDSRFHELMYKASGSTVLCDVLTQLHCKVQKYRTNSVKSPGRAKQSIKEHRDIYEAIAEGNEALAFKNATEHVLAAKKSIMKLKKEEA